jgi:arabinofuranosyltransferase
MGEASRRLTVVKAIVLTLFAGMLAYHAWRYAWVAEDAFINFRVIDNFKAGLGLTWNPGERVQVYTSTLWMALSIGMSALTGEPLYATVLLSFMLVALGFALLWRCSERQAIPFLTAGVALVCSHSVRDYLCSGLEPPLVMAAIMGFAAVLASRPAPGVARLALAVACCALVRHDVLPLVLPFALQALLQLPPAERRLPRLIGQGLLGASPLLAWSAFAWFYYGSPLPNTALAKMVGHFDTTHQARAYLAYVQHFDPLAYVLIGVTVLSTWAARSRWLWPLVVALLGFGAYLFHVGADYMAGRFMVGPLTLCAAVLAMVLAQAGASARVHGLLASLPQGLRERLHGAVMAGLLIPLSVQIAWYTHPSAYAPPFPVIIDGIADERQYYWGSTDLASIRRQGVQSPMRLNAIAIRESGLRTPLLACNIGMTGYYAPRDVQLIDPLALSDRFLAGLPPAPVTQRIGHFERPVPRDYLLSRLSGHNHFSDPTLAAYYDDVETVVRGPLWAASRLAAVWRLSTGTYHARLARWSRTDGGGTMQLAQVSPERLRLGCLGGIGRVMYPVLTTAGLTVQALPQPDQP